MEQRERRYSAHALLPAASVLMESPPADESFRVGPIARRQPIIYEAAEAAHGHWKEILHSLSAVRVGMEQCRKALTDWPQAAVPMLSDRIQDLDVLITKVRDLTATHESSWLRTSTVVGE